MNGSVVYSFLDVKIRNFRVCTLSSNFLSCGNCVFLQDENVSTIGSC
jgi:hypothetical protein